MNAETDKSTRGLTAEGWLTDCWYFISTTKDLKPGTQRRELVLNQPVLIGRTKAGDIFALRDICPHRLVPLSEGQQVDTEGQPTIQCPYHGWRFGTDGVCQHIPTMVDENYDVSKIKVRKYPVHIAHGLVFIYVADNPRSTEPPVIPPPDFGKLPDKPNVVVSQIYDCHMDDAVAGLIDPAHVPFIHNQWWWRPPSAGTKIKEKHFEAMDRGWVMAKHQPKSSSPIYKTFFGGDVTSEIPFQIPGYRWEVVENDKARLVSLSCLTPQEERKTRITQVTYWTNVPLMNLIAPFGKIIANTFLGQDRDIINKQNDGMKYQKAMLWIDDIDVQSKWYQTYKRAWAKARSENKPFENPVEFRPLKWRS